MLYFNNQELAESHHVSVRTVRNWIEAAKEGKLELALHSKGERNYIANTSRNLLLIKDLVDKGHKYRPHRAQKTVMPQSKFYELFNQEQIYDLVANLEINRETPYQYYYLGEGATNWNDYADRLVTEDGNNLLTSAVELLEDNKAYLDRLLKKYKQVNVIDIGVGNAAPVRKFLSHFIDDGRLGRYIAIDISPTMLGIAEQNLKKWFGDKLNFEGYSLDIDHDRFGHLLAEEYIKSKSDETTNIIMFLGGTIENFKKPGPILQHIHDSMGVHDFLIHQHTLDSKMGRQYFDFNPATPSTTGLAPIDRYILDLLNIDESLYDVVMEYDTNLGERNIRAVLKIALAVRVFFVGGERVITFNKGDSILLWRHRHDTMIDILRRLRENDFHTQQVSLTNSDQSLQSMLTISRIARDS